MVRVGLVGEDPNDTSSIKNLLEQRYKGKIYFQPLVKGIRGFQLDNPKIKRSLPIEFHDHNCHFVIFIRDLDAFKSQEDKFNTKIEWFNELNATLNYAGILLLNIWELEALIFGDINTFNKVYRIKHKFSGNPMLLKEPKEELKRLTFHLKKSYKESHCPTLFKLLNIEKLESSCEFFKDFMAEFNEKVK